MKNVNFALLCPAEAPIDTSIEVAAATFMELNPEKLVSVAKLTVDMLNSSIEDDEEDPYVLSYYRLLNMAELNSLS